MFRWATLSPLNRVKSLTDRLGEATGPGFVETSPAREISSSAKDAERAKRQPVTASSLFVSDGFDALQELDLLENCKSLILGWLKSLATYRTLLSMCRVGSERS